VLSRSPLRFPLAAARFSAGALRTMLEG